MALPTEENSDQSSKAAALIRVLDKDVLVKVLKHLNESELSRLTQAYDSEGGERHPDEQKLIGVAREFLASTATSSPSGHFKEALVIAVGEENASQILRQDPWRGIAKRISPVALADLLKDERPETVGIVLGKLPSVFSADILAHLPDQMRADGIERLTRSNPLAAASADALAAALEEGLSGATGESDSRAGIKAAAAMLNRIDSETALAIVEQIRAIEPARAEALEHEMFHFENLLTLDSRVLERILSEVQTDKLTTALKGLPDEQRDIILAALTDQVKMMVTAELEESGRVAASDVRAARREISTLALQLEQEGKVQLHADEREMLA